MKRLAPWAWVAVLGTALALSWWSLDALALHFGVPKLLAAMVSATFDGAALVAADLALRRAAVADSAAAVKLLMLTTVGLSAWLNYEHGALLGYPLVGRVLFAAPPIVSGWLFELQLRYQRPTGVGKHRRTARSVPGFGWIVWCFHPWAALRRLSQIGASRLRSVPVTVMDWEGSPAMIVGMPLGAPVGELEQATTSMPEDADIAAASDENSALEPPKRAGRTPVPDELYATRLREQVAENGGAIPSAREVARLLGVGQDRARRLIAVLKEE